MNYFAEVVSGSWGRNDAYLNRRTWPRKRSHMALGFRGGRAT